MTNFDKYQLNLQDETQVHGSQSYQTGPTYFPADWTRQLRPMRAITKRSDPCSQQSNSFSTIGSSRPILGADSSRFVQQSCQKPRDWDSFDNSVFNIHRDDNASFVEKVMPHNVSQCVVNRSSFDLVTDMSKEQRTWNEKIQKAYLANRQKLEEGRYYQSSISQSYLQNNSHSVGRDANFTNQSSIMLSAQSQPPINLQYKRSLNNNLTNSSLDHKPMSNYSSNLSSCGNEFTNQISSSYYSVNSLTNDNVAQAQPIKTTRFKDLFDSSRLDNDATTANKFHQNNPQTPSNQNCYYGEQSLVFDNNFSVDNALASNKQRERKRLQIIDPISKAEILIGTVSACPASDSGDTGSNSEGYFSSTMAGSPHSTSGSANFECPTVVSPPPVFNDEVDATLLNDWVQALSVDDTTTGGIGSGVKRDRKPLRIIDPESQTEVRLRTDEEEFQHESTSEQDPSNVDSIPEVSVSKRERKPLTIIDPQFNTTIPLD